jgi:hypothetical protein
MVEPTVDPWPPAQEALFNIVRAWVNEFPDVDQEKVASECLEIMENVNETRGAPFIFVCELARVLATVLAKYLCACNDTFPTAEQMLAEIDVLEMEYIEEFVVAETEESNGVSSEEQQE